MRIRPTTALAAVIAVAIVPTIASAAATRGHATTSQREFGAAAPALFPVIGPAPNGHYPACRSTDLRRSAHTRTTPDGVIGVVHLRYRRHHRCSLHLRRSPTGLLTASGHRLPVRARAAAPVDAGETARPDLALHYGDAIWGFAWRGSWCGRAARFVRMQLRSGAHLRVPLTGPAPTCDGTSHSVMLRGLVGGVGSAVQTAPPEWSGLTAVIHPAGTTDGQFLTGAAIRLTNSTAQPIPLDPCPAFSISIASHEPDGPSTFDTGGFLRGCTGSQWIQPGQALRLGLPKEQYTFVHHHAKHGSSLTITVAVAGLPHATAHVPVP